ncbi:MAG: hypothetical protein IT211_07405, partial [Armatimonadetes bacterium]|nr:hypothetical protein [Armatimonadota bacterium]
TLTGDGTSGNPLGVNLASANTWTATQTLPTTAGQGNALIASTNSGSTTINAVRIGAGLTDAQVNDNLTISGGTVDGTPVGATTRSTGAFTTLGANGAVTLGDGNDNITLNAGTGIISASSDKIENVADPTAPQDAATKNYVDNQITSTAWLLGGNTSPSSNIFGTVSATDIDVRTGNATRMTVGSGGGIGINATPVSTTKLAVGTVDATGGIGVAVNMTGTTTSTGVKVTNVGATGANDAGLAISAAAGGTGIGIRLGGGAGANLATGINITGGTGISYNAATAGTGTGISVGGTTRPATGGSFEGATVAVQAQSGATRNGVIASAATTPVAPPTGVALAGFSQNNTGNTTSRGVYGEAASSGSGAATTTLGAVGTANSTGGTNSGLSVGVHGTAAGAGNGTNAVVGGFFQTTGGTGNRFAIVANGGGDVYLGSSDANRPASLTAGSYIGTGNTNTTYMNAIRSSGTAGTANVRMGSLSGAALTGTYTPTANDGIIVADNNGDLLKRSVSSTVASVSWALTGNTGTTAGTNFLGTTDAQAFEIHVDEGGTATEGRRRVMRFEPNANSANIIGGFNGNSVTAGAIGATISGGGANGATNSVTDDYGVVGGGQSNRAGDNAGATNDNQYATVSGGLANTASASYATVGGGQSNTASGAWSTVNGGFTNTASGGTATVGGGVTNTASAPSATVGGGESNMASAGYTAVGGGQGNTASASHATVSGGNGNTASDTYATVGGGFSNMAAGSRSAIPGGYGLTLDATADRSFGFHANNAGGSLPMTISAPDVAVFGNTDLWLANNDNNPSELRFFEAYNTAGAFPSGTNYTAFKAQTQANDITYTLPAANGSAGQVLQVASSPAPTATTATLEWGGGPGVLYNVSSQQATATPRTNHLFDVAYAAAAPDAASTGARISSSAGAAGNNNATALTLVATPTGTGTATALNATGNIVLATAASQISNSAGDVTVADNLVVNSGGATDLTIAETGLDRNSAATETFAITNSGTGDAALLVNGATSVTNSRVAIANGHVTSQQTTALSTGTLGAGVASATLSNATDVAGLLDITTNSAAATGAQATVSFSLAYGTAPIVVLTPANGPAAGIGAHISRTTGGFTVSFIGLPANTTSYQFFYHVIETQ